MPSLNPNPPASTAQNLTDQLRLATIETQVFTNAIQSEEERAADRDDEDDEPLTPARPPENQICKNEPTAPTNQLTLDPPRCGAPTLGAVSRLVATPIRGDWNLSPRRLQAPGA